MVEFRVFWDKWRLSLDLVPYEGTDRIDLYVVYLGPFVFAYHREPV